MVVAYVAWCGFLFLMQRQMMFPRHMVERPSGIEYGKISIEKIWIATGRKKVEAWFLPPVSGKGKRPVVIFGHGNAELIDFWPQSLEPFTRLGIGVLLVEFPGYGRSGGSPSQNSITDTFVAAYDRIKNHDDVDPGKIILFGRSIGGGGICALSKKRPSAAMILMSCFTGTKSFAGKYFVPSFLVRDPFDNESAVRSYENPVLVIHGKYDEIIPWSHGNALHRAASQSSFVTYGSGHNDCPPDWNIFWRDMKTFLDGTGLI